MNMIGQARVPRRVEVRISEADERAICLASRPHPLRGFLSGNLSSGWLEPMDRSPAATGSENTQAGLAIADRSQTASGRSQDLQMDHPVSRHHARHQFMDMLTVDDTPFEVVDNVGWSTVPIFGGHRAPCFIQATVRVADLMNARLLNITGGTVRLKLAGGPTIEGHGLIRTGRMAILDQCVTVIYEGARVDEV